MTEGASRYLIGDGSGVAGFLHASKKGLLSMTYVNDWLSSQSIVSVVPDGALLNEFVYKIGSNTQRTLWSFDPAQRRSGESFYVSDGGDLLNESLGSGWRFDIATTTSGSSSYQRTFGTSVADSRIFSLNQTLSASGSITLTDDKILKGLHVAQDLKAKGKAGLLAAMVIDGAVSPGLGSYIYGVWRHYDPKWVPRKLSFSDILRKEERESRRPDYFWGPRHLSICGM